MTPRQIRAAANGPWPRRPEKESGPRVLMELTRRNYRSVTYAMVPARHVSARLRRGWRIEKSC